jgi:hypothetical protein
MLLVRRRRIPQTAHTMIVAVFQAEPDRASSTSRSERDRIGGY